MGFLLPLSHLGYISIIMFYFLRSNIKNILFIIMLLSQNYFFFEKKLNYLLYKEKYVTGTL